MHSFVGAAFQPRLPFDSKPHRGWKAAPTNQQILYAAFYKFSLSTAGYCTPFLKGYREEIFWAKAKIMEKRQTRDLELEFHPVTPERWSDFETLFGEKGACGGCWCMLWRLTRKEFERQKAGRQDCGRLSR